MPARRAGNARHALPSGADTVVVVEQSKEHDGRVTIHSSVQRGANILKRGEDTRRGAVLLPLGDKRIRAAVLYTADHMATYTASKRALRWGGNWWMPMLGGQQTTPLVFPIAPAYTLTRRSDPAKQGAIAGVSQSVNALARILGSGLGIPLLKIDYALTLSCYDPIRGRACGRCDACRLRRRGFEEADLPDPTRYART